jgi:hypothetical protein
LSAVRILASAFILGFSGTCRADALQTSPKIDSEILQLPPFRVTGGFFDFIARKKAGTQDMLDARVTWVSPAVYRLGLRKGDSMETIDGKAINGLASSVFLELLNRDPTPTDKTIFEFIGERYLFLVTAHITLFFSAPRAKMPSRSLEPMPSSGIPAVGQDAGRP